MADIGAALVARVEVKLDRLAKDLKKVGVLADDTIRDVENKFKRSNPTFGAFGGGLAGGLLGGIGANALQNVLTTVVRINREFADLARHAKEVGVSVERLQEFRIAGGRLGIEAKEMDKILDTIAKASREAERNKAETEFERILKANNVRLFDRNGLLLKQEQIVKNIADAVQRMGPGQRVDFVNALGLDRGAIKFFEQGSAGIRDMLADMKDVKILTEEEVRLAAELDHAFNKAATNWESRMKTAVVAIELAIQGLINKWTTGFTLPKALQDAVDLFNKLNPPTSLFGDGLGTLNIPAPSFIRNFNANPTGRAGQVLGGREARAVLDETAARERDLRGKIAELEQRISAARERGDEAGVIALGSRIDGLKAKIEGLKGAAAAPAAAKDVVAQVVGEPSEIEQKTARIQVLGDEIARLREKAAEGERVGGRGAMRSGFDYFRSDEVIRQRTTEIQQLTGEVEKLKEATPKEPLIVTVKPKIDPPLPPRTARQMVTQTEGQALGLSAEDKRKAEERVQAQQSLDRYIDTLMRQKEVEKAISETLFLRKPEQLAAIEIARAQVNLDKLSVEARQEYTQKVRDTVIALEEQREKTERAKAAQESLNQTINFVGNSAIDALDRIIVGGEKFSDVLKDIGRQFAKMILQAALLGNGPLAGLFGTSGSGGSAGGLLGGLLSGLGSGLLPASGAIFNRGGFTGRGNVNDVAGLVHRGEFVMDAESTRRAGPRNLAKLQRSLRRGFKDGGYAGSGPIFAQGGMGASPNNMHVTFGTAIDKQGNIYAFVEDVAFRTSSKVTQQGMASVIAGEPTRRRQYQARVA